MRFVWLLVTLFTVIIDYLTKYAAVLYLKGIETFPIIEGVIHFTYVENRGAAFGMLKNHRWVFMVISTFAILFILSFIAVYPKSYRNPLLFTGLSFIAGGGIGNMIDRITLSYVVDFIDFRLIDFAVFNVADSFVCIGCALIMIYVIFFDLKKPNSQTDTNNN